MTTQNTKPMTTAEFYAGKPERYESSDSHYEKPAGVMESLRRAKLLFERFECRSVTGRELNNFQAIMDGKLPPPAGSRKAPARNDNRKRKLEMAAI